MITTLRPAAWLMLLCPYIAIAGNVMDSIESIKKINSIVENVGAAQLIDSLERQKISLSKEEKILSKQVKNPVIKERISEIRESKQIVTGAQEFIRETQEPEIRSTSSVSSLPQFSLSLYLETIRATQNPSWVICSSFPWKSLDRYGWMDYIDPVKNNISSALSGVGIFKRFSKGQEGDEIFGDYGPTGFIVSPSYIITNKHVLKRYAYEDNGGWKFNSGQQLYISFPLEYSRCQKKTDTMDAKVISIRYVGSDGLDFAVLQIEPKDELKKRILALSDKFDIGPEARVAAIGYPGRPRPCQPGEVFNKEDPCTFLKNPQIDDFFREPDKSKADGPEFPAERISPGYLMRDPTASPTSFLYDSSTWGGSSGSPVISLADGKVVGIHFAGVGGNVENTGYNKALKIATIAPILRKEGIIK